MLPFLQRGAGVDVIMGAPSNTEYDEDEDEEEEEEDDDDDDDDDDDWICIVLWLFISELIRRAREASRGKYLHPSNLNLDFLSNFHRPPGSGTIESQFQLASRWWKPLHLAATR